MSNFDDSLNALDTSVQTKNGLGKDVRAGLAEHVKATREKYADVAQARTRKLLDTGKKKGFRLSNTYSFTCSDEVFAAIAAGAEDRSRARSLVVRNALISYLNLTMLERKQVWVEQRKDLALLGNGPRCVTLELQREDVRERLEHVTNKDSMSTSEVFRRALWYFAHSGM